MTTSPHPLPVELTPGAAVVVEKLSLSTERDSSPFHAHTVAELREALRAVGCRGTSGLRRAELIALAVDDATGGRARTQAAAQVLAEHRAVQRARLAEELEVTPRDRQLLAELDEIGAPARVRATGGGGWRYTIVVETCGGTTTEGQQAEALLAERGYMCNAEGRHLNVFPAEAAAMRPGARPVALATVHRCASPTCPGLPWKASDSRHPCRQGLPESWGEVEPYDLVTIGLLDLLGFEASVRRLLDHERYDYAIDVEAAAVTVAESLLWERGYRCNSSGSTLHAFRDSETLDELTRRITAFETFEAMLTAGGGYRPTLWTKTARFDKAGQAVEAASGGKRRLADAYDREQARRGDSRRAFRGY